MDQPRLRASRVRGLSGALLLGLGALFLAVSGAYYVYSVIAKSRMEALTYTLERPSSPAPFSSAVLASGDTQAGAVLDAPTLQVAGSAAVNVGEDPVRQGRAALAKVSGSGAAGAVREARPPSGVAVAATADAIPEVNGGAGGPPSPQASLEGQVVGAVAHVAGSEMASAAPVGEQQSEADAFARTDIGLEANGGTDKPASAQVSVETQDVTAAGAQLELAGLTSPVAVPLASVEAARSVRTVGTESEDAVTELPKATSADVALAQDGVGSQASVSLGLGNDESSEAAAVSSPIDTDHAVLSADDREMVAYLESEVRKAGLSSAEWAGLNAEVAKYSLPSPFDLNGARLTATRIRIPAIHLDSDVSELQVVLSDDQRVWATPKWVVGHIPTTALPGEHGQGWYFGHLESLIRGEGSIFRRLPEIPELLAEGEPIYVFLETADRKYLYQVYKTDWVHQDDLRVVDSGQQDITLVTCFPRLIYDHRVLVTAALVGVSES